MCLAKATDGNQAKRCQHLSRKNTLSFVLMLLYLLSCLPCRPSTHNSEATYMFFIGPRVLFSFFVTCMCVHFCEPSRTPITIHSSTRSTILFPLKVLNRATPSARYKKKQTHVYYVKHLKFVFL